MACYHPLRAFRSRLVGKSGKRAVVFSPDARDGGEPISVPCGQCIGCRLERSRQWAIRCVHEASLYERNCFITLTYDDDHLPKSMSLDKSSFQKFMKRLRKKFGSGVRYFHCGEYGERFGRPHYHACLFNFDFDDKVPWKRSPSGDLLYTSKVLSDLWEFGFSSIGSVSFESAAYVARYVMKKITGARAKEHYTYIDLSTGEWFQRSPEYTTMSRRPGIGEPWLKKYLSDVYPDDFVVLRGIKMKPAKFYDSKMEILSPVDFESIKLARKMLSFERADDNTWQRLQVKERIVLSRVQRLKRGIEDEA